MFTIVNNRWKTIVLLICLSLIFVACSTKELQLVPEKQFVLGTVGDIQVYSTSTNNGRKAIGKAYQRIRSIEDIMSIVVEDSDIYNINQQAGKTAVKVDDETLKVIEKGIFYYELTDGAFNIGLGALINLWDMSIQDGATRQTVPKPNEVEWAKQHIDLNNLEINGNSVFLKDADMRLDLGGIAKGYAVDEAARVLKEEGIESGFVNLGGDIYVLGPKPDGAPWAMGIQNPEKGTYNAIIRLPLANKAIVTSGDYERGFEADGIHYHHILDPETGYPTSNELSSATIIANTALEADILSTAVFIMGLEEGLRFIEELEDIEGIFVTKDKEIYVTSGLKDEIVIRDPSFELVN